VKDYCSMPEWYYSDEYYYSYIYDKTILEWILGYGLGEDK
jgi:hypothetical protein